MYSCMLDVSEHLEVQYIEKGYTSEIRNLQGHLRLRQYIRDQVDNRRHEGFGL